MVFAVRVYGLNSFVLVILVVMLIGIVGKPNVGKSAFFKALTLIEVASANYPFTTIEPNRGIGFVKIDCVDTFFNTQCNPRSGYCINHKRFVPVELIDVAGLVPGAHEGKGLGNKFLDDLRQADALIHVIDLSGGTNEKGEGVEPGTYDPKNDIVFLEEEIGLWFFGVLKNLWPKISRQPVAEKSKKMELFQQSLSGLGINGKQVDFALNNLKLSEKNLKEFTDEDLKGLAFKLREISKPILIAANKCDVATAKPNLERLKREFPNLLIIPCSAEAEVTFKKAAKAGFIEYVPGDSAFKELKELNEQQKKGLNLLKEKVLNEYGNSGVQNAINSAVFELLKYKPIFPGGLNNLEDSDGNILPDCFLMPPDATALDFAFRLHTDIGKNFIKAIDVKRKQLIGKDYVLKFGDVVEIAFNK